MDPWVYKILSGLIQDKTEESITCNSHHLVVVVVETVL